MSSEPQIKLEPAEEISIPKESINVSGFKNVLEDKAEQKKEECTTIGRIVKNDSTGKMEIVYEKISIKQLLALKEEKNNAPKIDTILSIYRWNKENTFKLIQLVKERSCIWKQTPGDYRKQTELRTAFKEIESELKISVNAIKRKLFMLRCQYAREMTREKKDKLFTSKWEFLEPTQFMFGDTNTKFSPVVSTNECVDCNKKFKTINSLKRHRKNHLVSTNECVDCNKKFKTINSLKRHRKNHPTPKLKSQPVEETETVLSICKWNKENTFKLIQLVKERSCIWKQTPGVYPKETELKTAFKEIESELKISVNAIKRKLIILRCQYAREMTKEKKDKLFTSKWEFLEPTQFMFGDTNKKFSPVVSSNECVDCNKKFKTIYSLKRHRKNHPTPKLKSQPVEETETAGLTNAPTTDKITAVRGSSSIATTIPDYSNVEIKTEFVESIPTEYKINKFEMEEESTYPTSTLNSSCMATVCKEEINLPDSSI